MKKRYVLLSVVLFILLIFSIPVYAQGVDIYTNVPRFHIVTLNVNGGGKVCVNSEEINGSYRAERQSRLKYSFIPCEGYRLDRVVYDGNDITLSLKDDFFTSAPLVHDTVMNVTFVKNSDQLYGSDKTDNIFENITDLKTSDKYENNHPFLVETGDLNNNVIYICIASGSLLAIILCILLSKRKSKI